MVLRSASYRLRPWVRDPVRGIVRGGLIVRLEARWSELSPTSWEVSRRPVAVHYQARVAAAGLPPEGDVWYVHMGIQTHLVHSSEIGDEVPEDPARTERRVSPLDPPRP